MSFNSASNGFTLPTVKYTNSISEEFPNGNRTYKVETAIAGRYMRDHLPINSNLTNGSINDNYIEFVLNSNQQELVDCNSFVLEMKIKLVKPDGSEIDDNDKVNVIDGLGHRILSRCTIFLNGVPCESNSYFGLYNNINTYISMGKDSLPSLGRNMYYKDIHAKINSTIDATTFTNQTNDEKEIERECKSILHMMTPLKFNISSADFYLLNGVDIRLRFDLAPAKLIINSYDDINYSYVVHSVKLWTQKIIPDPAALLSLNKSLLNNQTIEYIHDRPIIKNFVFPTGQSSLSLDNMFNGIIPQMIHMVFFKQSAVSGEYNVNGAHFSHCNLSSLRMEINGNTFVSMSSSFPNNIANLFYHTLSNLKDDKNLLTLQSYKNGRTIYSWDLRTSDCSDVLNVEKSGNVRINFQTDKPVTENYFVFVIGITTGLIEIDGARRVKTSYLM